MKAINITAYTDDITKIDAIKAVLKAMKVKFEIAKAKSYNTEFVSMVAEAEAEIKKGKSTKITSTDFDKLWK